MQAVAGHWTSEAGRSVIGVTATGDRVPVNATGPNPAPDLAMLRQDLDAASLAGLYVWISLVRVGYQPLPEVAEPRSSSGTGWSIVAVVALFPLLLVCCKFFVVITVVTGSLPTCPAPA